MATVAPPPVLESENHVDLSDSNRDEDIALEALVDAGTSKAIPPDARIKPTSAAEECAEGVLGASRDPNIPPPQSTEPAENTLGGESDKLDSLGVWLLTIQHFSR